jgi:hypothetical protein
VITTLNRKIDKALDYIIIDTLGGDCLPFTQKSIYFVMWTKKRKFVITSYILGAHQYM